MFLSPSLKGFVRKLKRGHYFYYLVVNPASAFVLESWIRENVITMKFPAHETDVFQSLHVACFGPF